MAALRQFAGAIPDVRRALRARGPFRRDGVSRHGTSSGRPTRSLAEVAARTGPPSIPWPRPPRVGPTSPRRAFDPAHSEALARFLDHVDVVLTIHGYGRLLRHTSCSAGAIARSRPTWPATSGATCPRATSCSTTSIASRTSCAASTNATRSTGRPSRASRSSCRRRSAGTGASGDGRITRACRGRSPSSG